MGIVWFFDAFDEFSYVCRFLSLQRVDEKRCSAAEVWRRKILARLRVNIQPHRGAIHTVVNVFFSTPTKFVGYCLVLFLYPGCLLGGEEFCWIFVLF